MRHNLQPVLTLLQTGQFGNLALDMHIDDVLNYLGIPDYCDSIADLRKTSPGLWHTEDSEKNVFPGMLYGTLAILFRRARVRQIIFMAERFPEHTLPPPLDDSWIATIQHMTQTEFDTFLAENHLTHIRYRNKSVPPARGAQTPPLKIKTNSSTSHHWLQAIYIGNPFS